MEGRQNFQLNGGQYELTNFPLRYGYNDIELIFTDLAGNKRTEYFLLRMIMRCRSRAK